MLRRGRPARVVGAEPVLLGQVEASPSPPGGDRKQPTDQRRQIVDQVGYLPGGPAPTRQDVAHLVQRQVQQPHHQRVGHVGLPDHRGLSHLGLAPPGSGEFAARGGGERATAGGRAALGLGVELCQQLVGQRHHHLGHGAERRAWYWLAEIPAEITVGDTGIEPVALSPTLPEIADRSGPLGVSGWLHGCTRTARNAAHFGAPTASYEIWEYAVSAPTALDQIEAQLDVWLAGVRGLGEADRRSRSARGALP